MTRHQLEHVIRAAASVSDDDEIFVIGSQSILASAPDARGVLVASMEADVFPKNHPERRELIDGALGEESPFHLTFGCSAQGVGEETAILPDGWRDRVVAVRNANTRGATGWALEPHDLAVGRYAAGREKDRVFLRAAIRERLLDQAALLERLGRTPRLPEERRREIAEQVAADFEAALGTQRR
jgi:hypothetical protein